MTSRAEHKTKGFLGGDNPTKRSQHTYLSTCIHIFYKMYLTHPLYLHFK